jgi:pimeloyl-ACP methyl ester carboxylesterase
VICWDYRGLGQSVMPDPEHGEVSIPRHARDALCILDHLEVDRAIFIGWSMGVLVSLEVYHHSPERMAGFVALLGTYSRPFYNAFGAPTAWSIDKFFRFLNKNPRLVQRTLDLAITLPRLTFFLLSNLAFVGKDADREIFAADVRSVAGVDKSIYTRTMLAMADHDAGHILPRLTCPALVIAGQRDYMTPPRVARWMAETMPNAEYREVKGGTHFSMIEQPELVNTWLLEFARRVFSQR